MSLTCQNTLTVVGSEKDLANFKLTHIVNRAGIHQYFDFNTVIETPQKLTDISKIKAWRLENWGVISNGSQFSMIQKYCVLKCRFRTPWTAPEKLIEKLIKNYPNMSFNLRFEDNEMQFFGSLSGGSGKITNNELNEIPARGVLVS